MRSPIMTTVWHMPRIYYLPQPRATQAGSWATIGCPGCEEKSESLSYADLIYQLALRRKQRL